jgi:hypothetical protein
MPLKRLRRQRQALPRLYRDFLRDPFFPRSSANYLTVIYHRDIGSPFRSAYRHGTRFSGTGKGVVLLADSPKSDDSEKVN